MERNGRWGLARHQDAHSTLLLLNGNKKSFFSIVHCNKDIVTRRETERPRDRTILSKVGQNLSDGERRGEFKMFIHKQIRCFCQEEIFQTQVKRAYILMTFLRIAGEIDWVGLSGCKCECEGGLWSRRVARGRIMKKWREEQVNIHWLFANCFERANWKAKCDIFYFGPVVSTWWLCIWLERAERFDVFQRLLENKLKILKRFTWKRIYTRSDTYMHERLIAALFSGNKWKKELPKAKLAAFQWLWPLSSKSNVFFFSFHLLFPSSSACSFARMLHFPRKRLVMDKQTGLRTLSSQLQGTCIYTGHQLQTLQPEWPDLVSIHILFQ